MAPLYKLVVTLTLALALVSLPFLNFYKCQCLYAV